MGKSLKDLGVVYRKIKNCEYCSGSCKQYDMRLRPGRGAVFSPLLVVGLSPFWHTEPEQLPVVGKNGLFFDQVMDDLGITWRELYCTSLLKCPRENVAITTQEDRERCGEALDQQLRVLKPVVVLTLGVEATDFLMGKASGNVAMSRLEPMYSPLYDTCVQSTFPLHASMKYTAIRQDFEADFGLAFDMAYQDE